MILFARVARVNGRVACWLPVVLRGTEMGTIGLPSHERTRQCALTLTGYGLAVLPPSA